MPETCRSVHTLKCYGYLNQVCAFVHLHHNIWITMHRMENVTFIKSSSFNYNPVNLKTAQYCSHDSGWRMQVGLLTWSFRCGRLWGTVWLVKCDNSMLQCRFRHTVKDLIRKRMTMLKDSHFCLCCTFRQPPWAYIKTAKHLWLENIIITWLSLPALLQTE
jgi:hypothetical protein